MTMTAADSPDAALSDYTDETSTFGDRLTTARESQGLDQAGFARRIGVKVQTLRNWEEDRSEPRANRLQMIAGMLNVPIVWLMSGQGDLPVALEPEVELDDGLEACLGELRRLRLEQAQMVEKLGRLEKRLRAAMA